MATIVSKDGIDSLETDTDLNQNDVSGDTLLGTPLKKSKSNSSYISVKEASRPPMPPLPAATLAPPDTGTSFFSSVLSAAGNVLRGTSSSHGLEHKRSLSDGTFFRLHDTSSYYHNNDLNKRSLDDLTDSSMRTTAESDTASAFSGVPELRVEPAPARPSIDTIGHGELSLEALGLTPVLTAPPQAATMTFPSASAQPTGIPILNLPGRGADANNFGQQGGGFSNTQTSAGNRSSGTFIPPPNHVVSGGGGGSGSGPTVMSSIPVAPPPAAATAISATPSQQYYHSPQLQGVSSSSVPPITTAPGSVGTTAGDVATSDIPVLNIPELVVQQPERTSTPQFTVQNPDANLSGLNLNVTDASAAAPKKHDDLPLLNPITGLPGPSSLFSPDQQRQPISSSSTISRPTSPANPSGGISSAIAASSLAMASAALPMATDQITHSKSFSGPHTHSTLATSNSFRRSARDRSSLDGAIVPGTVTSFLRSPSGSLRGRRRRKSSDISPIRLNTLVMDNEKSDGDDVVNNTTSAMQPVSTNTILGNRRSAYKGHLVGFAYANKRRNQEFHRLFRSLPPYDLLLDDHSCALSKDILIQGRMYISEHNVCFNSNILGWVTTLVIGFDEIVGLEKKMTAGLFPNGITIQTLHNRYSFASFISRDSVYEFLMSIWKQAGSRAEQNESGSGDGNQYLTEDNDFSGDSDDDSDSETDDDNEDDDEDGDSSGYEESGSDLSSVSSVESEDEFGDSVRSPRTATAGHEGPNGGGRKSFHDGRENGGSEGANGGGEDGGSGGSSGGNANGGASGGGGPGDDGNGGRKWPVSNLGPETHAPSNPNYDYNAAGEKLLLTETIKAPLGVVVNLLFGNDVTWLTKFNTDNQKNFDLAHFGAFSSLAPEGFRKYEYTKPINGSIGPKQTRCICTDNIEKWDLESHVSVTTSTQTPDVPSGNSFSTKTRYTIWWAGNNHTTLMLTYKMEWTGRSLVKGLIEKGTQDGQMEFAKALVEELNGTVKAVAGPKVGGAAAAGGKKGKAGKKVKTKGKSKKAGAGEAEETSRREREKAEREAREAAARRAAAEKSYVSIVLDMLLSNPIDIVPIPTWGFVLIGVFILWLFGAFSSGGSNKYGQYDDLEIPFSQFLDARSGQYDIEPEGQSRASSWSFGKKTKKQGRGEDAGVMYPIGAYGARLARIRLEEEYLLWSWIEDRSRFLGHDSSRLVDYDKFVKQQEEDTKNGGGSSASASTSTSTSTSKSKSKSAVGAGSGGYSKDLRVKYRDQTLKEAVRLTELRLAEIKRRYEV